ncbi:hypothetical protein V1477_003406 [Vespula maculifrons]|uniref:Uncharacterized protein n=1 Tax=Vespula maculifrons TaxID=7453 RepID=A0ABD2CUF5_VESMC
MYKYRRYKQKIVRLGKVKRQPPRTDQLVKIIQDEISLASKSPHYRVLRLPLLEDNSSSNQVVESDNDSFDINKDGTVNLCPEKPT